MSGENAEITASRSLKVERLSGSVDWVVNEFDTGRVMLVAQGPGLQVNTHFSSGQWAEFQKLIAGGRS